MMHLIRNEEAILNYHHNLLIIIITPIQLAFLHENKKYDSEL